jgi:hypothetical protein
MFCRARQASKQVTLKAAARHRHAHSHRRKGIIAIIPRPTYELWRMDDCDSRDLTRFVPVSLSLPALPNFHHSPQLDLLPVISQSRASPFSLLQFEPNPPPPHSLIGDRHGKHGVSVTFPIKMVDAHVTLCTDVHILLPQTLSLAS